MIGSSTGHTAAGRRAGTGGANGGGFNDLGRLLDEMVERVGRNQELEQGLDALVGRAQSPDGLVAVGCTSTDPLHELWIDPRAMRYPPDDLATLLRGLARQARDDLQAQTEALLREAGGDDDAFAYLHDPGRAQSELENIQAMLGSGITQSTQMFEYLHRRFKAGG